MTSTSHPPVGHPRVLILVRHGKAAPRLAELSDFERGLTQSGFDESARVAEWLQAKGLRVDHVISSPADRALETAHVLAGYLDLERRRIRVVPALYDTTAVRPIKSLLRALDDQWHVVLACGHNPLMDKLATHLLPKFSGSLQKSEAVGIGFACESWRGLAAGRGTLLFRLLPGPDPRTCVPTSRVAANARSLRSTQGEPAR